MRITLTLLLICFLGIACAQIPIPAGFPNETNTGIAGAGVSPSQLTQSGSITVTTDGTVLEMLDVSGSITVKANNVIIRKCRITGGIYGIRCSNGNTGLLVEDCTLVKSSPGGSAGFYGWNFTMRRCVIGNYVDAMKCASNSTVEDSLLHDLAYLSGTHNDGVQCRSGSNIVFRHNTIKGGYRMQTSAMLFQTADGSISNVTLEGNFLSGGGYTLYLRDKGNGPPTNVLVKDNVFEKDSYFGGHLSQNGSHTFQCNVWHTGEPIPQNPPCTSGPQPPVANAGPDQQVIDADGSGDEIVILDGSASYDPDQDIISYEWKEGTSVLATEEISMVTLSLGLHVVSLTVIDSGNRTSVDTIQVNVIQQPAVQNILEDYPWVQTGEGNSLIPTDGLFEITNDFIVTDSTDVNIHAHAECPWTWSEYTYSGKMKIGNSSGGIGVTILSDYINADKYYRLRRYASQPAFHVAPHGTTVSGTTTTGVVPQPNIWYKFKVQVQETGVATRILAKVWQEGTAEPNWQADCQDSSGSRLTSGRPGVWSMSAGTKSWKDLKVLL